MTWAREYPLPANGQACVGAIADSIERDLEEELGAERAKVESESDGWSPPLEVEEIKEGRERLLKACAEKDAEITRLVMSGSGAKAFVERIRAAAEDREDVTLFGTDYLAYPLDADGEPIHVGDVMEWPTTGETFEVVGIGDGTLFYVEDGSECADWTGATTKRHHHAPTVEDVLREFAAGMDEIASEYICEMIGGDERNRLEDEHIAKFAAKLRLANDND